MSAVVVLTPDELRALIKSAVTEALNENGRAAPSDTLSLSECGVSVRTLRAAIASGELPAAKTGREYRVRRSDLDAWLEARRVQPIAPAVPAATGADRAIARAMRGAA